LFASAVR
jgi:hypothetical protein